MYRCNEQCNCPVGLTCVDVNREISFVEEIDDEVIGVLGMFGLESYDDSAA